MNTCLQHSDSAKDVAAEAGVIEAAVTILGNILRKRAATSPIDGVVNGAQLLKTLIGGGGSAFARKERFTRAGGLALMDAVLSACHPHTSANLQLRSIAETAKNITTMTTIGVGGATVFTSLVPCSNTGCTAARASKCGTCGAPYCSPACQRAHWPVHKKECKRRSREAAEAAAARGAEPAPEESDAAGGFGVNVSMSSVTCCAAVDL